MLDTCSLLIPGGPLVINIIIVRKKADFPKAVVRARNVYGVPGQRQSAN